MAALAAAWLAAGGESRAVEADAREWLKGRGLSGGLTSALSPQLNDIWRQGFQLGQVLAGQLAGSGYQIPEMVLDDLIQEFGPIWTDEIAGTLLDGIARVLISGENDQARLERHLQDLLENKDNAQRIARTELVRAANAAAIKIYELAGTEKVRWLTAHDAEVCVNCKANEDAGPWTLGHPFPSGAIQPPQHPRCRCLLIPA